MSQSSDTIKAPKGSHRRRKRVGRGNSSQKGTSAGRGTKGQRARSGGKSRSSIRALKDTIQKVPKLRGFRSLKTKNEIINLSVLNKIAIEGDEITPEFLVKKGVISHSEKGIKILATGEITKKLKIKGYLVSKKAVECIEKAGGSIEF